MITPNQIRERKISIVESDGYDRNEVNDLLLDIIESYESVFEENKELYRKMEILANRIEEYRADEDSIKTTLIMAQKMADKVTVEAKEKAEKTITESAASAQKTVIDAKEKAEKIIGEARDYVAGLTKEKAKAADEMISEAEKKANEAISGAKIVAQNVLDHARDLSQEIITKAKTEKEYHQGIVSKLKSESKDFRESLVSLYETQLDKLKNIIDFSNESDDAGDEISKMESELDSLLSEMEDVTAADTENVTADKIAQESEEISGLSEEIADVGEEDDIDEITLREENADTNEESTASQHNNIEDEIEEIIEEIEETDTLSLKEEDDPPTEEEVEDALDAFTRNEITPVDEHEAIPVIDEEPEFENRAMPFESYFNVNKEDPKNTAETISLIPPDDEDEDDSSKFRGFFKKKK